MADPTNIEKYMELLGLSGAEFCRIDHDDTMIAVVYKVLRPSNPPLILKLCAHEQDYHREIYFLRLLGDSLPVPGSWIQLNPAQRAQEPSCWSA